MQINVVIPKFVHSHTLTVAISAGNRPDLRERLLTSLRSQASPWDEVEILVGHPTLNENLSQVRNRLYREAGGRWVYFVDEDCELPDFNYLTRLVEQSESKGGSVGGFYLGGENIWQKAYNALANFWLGLHHEQGQGLPVAGNFALPKHIQIPAEFPFGKTAFGGEEVHLKKRLDDLGIRFHLLPELSVRHNGKKAMRGFYSRAWRHGQGPRQTVKHRRAAVSFFKAATRSNGLIIPVLMISYMFIVWLARRLPGEKNRSLDFDRHSHTQ